MDFATSRYGSLLACEWSFGLFVAVIVSQFGTTFTFRDEKTLAVNPGPGGGGPIFQLESGLAEVMEAEALELERHPIKHHVRHHHGSRRFNETRRRRRQNRHHALEAYLKSEARNSLYFNRRPQRRHLADNPPGRFYVVGSGNTDGSGDSGPWGPWSEPSECSRSCGGGIAFQTRSCLETEPDGTSKCIGGLRRYYSCNIRECPDVSGDFRSEQCAQFDDVQFEGRYYKWIPYTKAPNRCELNCMPRGERFYYRHKRKVIDGTRCDEEKLDICVDGDCLPVGCDMILGSDAKEDQCRECGGDGSGCNTVKGLLQMNDLVVGYNDILLIPAGATNILVRELEASNNYLAIRNTTNHYYLNGNWRIDFPRDLRFAGTVFHYGRRPHGFYAPESIRALGPTSEAIYIVLLYQEVNRGVQYEYSIPKGVTHQTDPDSYTWVAGEFEECSATCGGGVKTRQVICARRRDQEVVPNDLCDPGSRLPSNVSCAEEPCPPQWSIGEWGQCSETCGGEDKTGGIRTRKIHCEQIVAGGLAAVIDDSLCEEGDAGPAPPSSEPCNQDIVCPIWHVGPWKPCDRLCGEGQNKRQVVCYRKIKDVDTGKDVIEVLSDDACPSPVPEDSKPCMQQPCEGIDWIVSEWSGCENKCGLAKETRQAFCSTQKGKIYPPERCQKYRLPPLERECMNLAPCEYNWYASQWSECSASCGKGVKTREVFCGALKDFTITRIEDEKCDAEKKYATEEECIGKEGEECKGQWFSGPWSACSKECGGGVMSRQVLCIAENKTVPLTECDQSTIAFTSETCNNQPCGADQIVPMEPTHVIDEEEECEEEDGTYETLETTLGLGSTGTGVSATDDQTGSTQPESTVTATTAATETLTTSTTESEGTVTEGTTTEGTTQTEGTATTVLMTTVSETTVTPPTTMDETTTEAETMTTATEGTTISDATTPPTVEASTTVASTTEASTTEASTTEAESTDTTVSEGGTTTAGTTDDATTVTMTTEMPESTTTGTSGTESSTTPATETTQTDETETTPTEVTETTGTETTDTTQTETTDTTQTETTDTTQTETTDTTQTETTDTTQTETTETTITETTVTDGTDETESSETTTAATTEGTTSAGTTGTTVTSTDEETAASSETTEGTTMTDMSTSEESTESTEATDDSTTPKEVTEAPMTTTTVVEKKIEKEAAPPVVSEIDTDDLSEEYDESSEETSPSDITETESNGLIESELGSGFTSAETYDTDDYTSILLSSLPQSDAPYSPTDDLTTGTGDVSESTASTAYSSKFSIIDAITKEQKIKKCKRRKKPSRETVLVKSCKESEFGCCNDDVTFAKGPFSKGCPQPETCEETKFGCCASDGVTPAEGPAQLGCPPTLCNESLFGCCPDGISSAEGNNFEGCKEEEIVPFICKDTEFGCCPDGLTAATGPNHAGCFVCEGSGECDKCSDTKYGCCSDNVRAATGPDFAGCEDLEGSGDDMGFSTTEGEDCHITVHGCCPDGRSTAEGPYFAGCDVINEENCTESYFGCCPDGETAARGPENYECPMPCKTEKHGCCEDNITPAHGPNGEGCCLNTAYGCCPDNILPAQGPNLEGCGCQYTTYGCCPDNETAARGPEKEGCGCQHTTFGCCPDRYTPASGPNFGGCLCHTYQFGCCPDGATIARGPHRQGCGCENTEFGCCSDEKTPRTRQDEECGCEASKHGCCPDGETPADGDKFEGCEDVPSRPGEMCTLAKDRGPCREFSVKWFFDMEYGGCSRFWYGGCHGNTNRFKNQDECKATCVEPQGRDACFLPKVEGPCDGYYPTWYYDQERKQCGQFIYGGCLGNNNKFQTREECEELCVIPDNIDACEQPKVEGPCRGNYSRWYYDQEDRMCRSFTYGGCKGNDNNFHTEKACHQQCLQPGRTREMCALPRAQGNCTERLPRWFFDGSENRCMPFYYSGCEGNANRFETQTECEETCPPKIELDTCMMPALVGECRNYTARWYYDSYELRCRQFYYGGCGGNQNNFASVEECQHRCESGFSTEAPVHEFQIEYCYYPEDSGPCSQSSEKWYYDRRDGVCKVFTYGGCQGNHNRFNSRQDCEQACGNAQDVCSLPRVVGPCSGSFQQWYYDHETDICQPFDYGGCQGNRNRFNDRESCERRCQKSSPTQPAALLTHVPVTQGPPEDIGSEICYMPLDSGQCTENLGAPDDDNIIAAWYYDIREGSCNAFSFSGCGGNANRFATEEQCERQCGRFRGHDICNVAQETGPCRGRFIKWYYDSLTGICREFIYGGCDGNGNRFSSADECESICVHKEELIPAGNDTSVSHQAVCRQPVDKGPCFGGFKRWYFDDERKACIPFIYGGCAGNQNRFKNYQTCRSFCSVLLGVSENEIEHRVPHEKADCLEIRERCNQLQCPYGVERSVDERDCETCQCHNPCEDHYCPIPGTVCIVDLYYPPDSDEAQFRGVCLPGSKAGHCPTPSAAEAANCQKECNSDADCNGAAKCCSNGCGQLCLMPVAEDELTTEEPARHIEYTTSIYEDSPRILQSDMEVSAEEGSYAILKCIAVGRPTPSVIWRRNLEIIDGSEGRHRLLGDGSLQIIALTRNDAGIYTCFASNGVGNPVKQDYRLAVTDPRPHAAEVVGDEATYVVVTLSVPTTLHCRAIGWPRPSVTWWRGERMLPLSSKRYEQRRDMTLLLRSVGLQDLGPYTCQAYNGIGKAASWTVTLQAVGPVAGLSPNSPYAQYLISPPERIGPTRPPRPQAPFIPVRPTPPTTPARLPEVTPPQAPPTDGGIVPVKANITLFRTTYPLSSDISIPCEVEGYPVPRVVWYKDDVPLVNSERVQLADPNRVIILRANTSDTGTYKCEASNPYGVSTSSVAVLVEGVFVHPNCTDNPFFANCLLIVKAHYCTHKYYARFCCRSCTLAGQLPSHGPHLDGQTLSFGSGLRRYNKRK